MSNSAKGLLLTSLGVFIMSLESLFIKITPISAFLFSFYIGIFMFISMISTYIFKERTILKKTFSNSVRFLFLSAFLMAISNSFFISAVKITNIANVVLIFSTSALFAALFSYLFYKEKIGKNIFIATIFIFIGLFIIFSDNLEIGSVKGNIYALFCTILFSLSFVFLAKHKDINRVLVTAFSGLFLSLVSLFFCEDLKIDVNTLFLVMIMGLLISPISRVLMGIGSKYISASEVSLLMIIETIMAPIWVWIFLNEKPTTYTFIGGSLILITLVINSLYSLKKEK